MTLKRIAELAGVSVSTVSKAFSGSEEISEETRQKIFEIAREQGCFDKYNKNKYNKKVIAVICPEIISDYYAITLRLLEEEIAKNAGFMTISCTNFSPSKEEELFNYYSSYCRADGILLINNRKEIKNANMIPAVSLSPSVNSSYIDTIEIDPTEAVGEAIRHLKAFGHTKIGYAGEALTYGAERRFRSAMEEADLLVEEELVCTGKQRFEEAGIEIVEQWMKRGICPTAVLAAYDYIAIGIIKGFRNHGVRVPEDVSVVGMNDISIIPYLDPPLSTVKSFSEEACRAAVELLMRKIENPYYVNDEQILFKGEFVARGSVAPRKDDK